MLYDYRKESKSPMLLTLANGKTIEGEFIDLRIATETLPKGKLYPLYTSLTILNISHLLKKLSSPVLKVVYPGRDWLL